MMTSAPASSGSLECPSPFENPSNTIMGFFNGSCVMGLVHLQTGYTNSTPLKVILVTYCEDHWKETTKNTPQIVLHQDQKIQPKSKIKAIPMLSQTQTQIGSLEPLSLRHPYNPLLFWTHPGVAQISRVASHVKQCMSP